MASNTSIIISREYLERVRKKSFIITTILMPLLMVLLAVAPTLIMIYSGDDAKKYSVIDLSGVVAPQLTDNEDISYVVVDEPLDVALSQKAYDGVIYIPANVVKTGSGVKVYSNDAISMPVEAQISGKISKAIEDERLKQYDIANLDKIMEEVKCDVKMQTIRVDEDDNESFTSSLISFALGELLTFMLYIALLLYGQMVMTSIIEEKNNRVLELVVSSVKPTQLMLGKIAGIGLVAVTQIVIWLVLMVGVSAFLIPALLPADVMSQVSAVNSGTLDMASATIDTDMLQALSILANPGYILSLFLYLLLFLVGGFLLYSAVFAAIGSAVDNIQDASQLQSIVIVPIILGLVFGMQAASAPTSTLAVITSLFPFTSPMVMLSRIPFDIPSWQIWLSLALLAAGVVFMIWLAAKIYRVGIFMYGKKPTLKELLRWARYK